jgi:hypothetical protein
MSAWIEAEIRAWIECKSCGRTSERRLPIRIPEQIAFVATEKAYVTCVRCDGRAAMYLQRVPGENG